MKIKNIFAAVLVGVLGITCPLFAQDAATGDNATSAEPLEILPTGGRNLYRLAVGRANSEPLIIGSTWDNRVCAFSPAGQLIWEAPVGGFVFDLAADDLDADGRDEILAACADGQVRAFAADGTALWHYDLRAPVYQVAVARLDGKTPVVLAGGISRELTVLNAQGAKVLARETAGALRLVRAGNFAGGSKDDVAVFTVGSKKPGPVQVYRGSQLALAPTVPGDKGAPLPEGTSRHRDGMAADLDGDGRAEWVSSEGVFSLAGKPMSLFALKEPGKPNYDYHYRMRQLTAGDLTSASGLEIVTLDGPEIMLHDARGKLLGHAEAPFGFTAIAYLPGKPFGSVLLGSSPNGDDNLYRLTFASGWEKATAALTRRGHMATIGTSLAELSTAAQQWQGQPAVGQPGPFLIHTGGGWMDTPEKLARIDRGVETARFYEKRFPYSNLVFVVDFWFAEAGPMLRPDGKPWEKDRRLKYQCTPAQIVETARKLERAKCHFFATSGHGRDPYISPQTAAEILQAAPTMCHGFIEAENEPREGPELAYYLQHHVVPILDVCQRHGHAILILREKNAWWAAQAATPDLRRLLFNGNYRSVLVPAVEDSNSRSHDLNLTARVGLWLDGQVDRWAVRVCSDYFSFNRAWEWEYPMTGHPHLRNYTAHTSLGASVFMFQSGERDKEVGDFTRVGLESAEPFLHLLGKGVIVPPTREQMRSLSPVLVNVLNPTERFLATVANGHALQTFSAADLKPSAFSRLDCYWGMAPTPASDVSAFVYQRTRQFDNTIPRTSSGFVALLAGSAPSGSGTPWTSIWTTDGDNLSQAGTPFTLDAARDAMLADLQAGAKKFPFRVDGEVFWQLVSQGPDEFLLYLIDPGYLDPVDRAVVIRAQIPGAWNAVDRLTGRTLGALDEGLAVTVPAGTLRLVEIHSASRPSVVVP